MSKQFDQAVVRAAAMLMEMPRQRQSLRDAQVAFEEFKLAHPITDAVLVTHTLPASDCADFDLLLNKAGRGILSMSWQADECLPWTAKYSDHWAANFVLSVNGFNTTIQSALIYLNSVMKGKSNLMEDMINRSLIGSAIAASPPHVSEEDIDQAVTAFRVGQNLFSAKATQDWLDETHLTVDALRELVTQNAQETKFKQALCAPSIGPLFEAHREDFDRITVLQISGLSRVTLHKLAKDWKRDDACPLFNIAWPAKHDPSGKVDTFYRKDMPPRFGDDSPRAVIGPIRWGTTLMVAQILKRSPACLDQRTRNCIADTVFDAWLQERRAKANVRWHWM